MERKDGVENKAPIPCGSQACQHGATKDNLRGNGGIIGRSAGTVKRRFRQAGMPVVLCDGDRQECLSHRAAEMGKKKGAALGGATE